MAGQSSATTDIMPRHHPDTGCAQLIGIAQPFEVAARVGLVGPRAVDENPSAWNAVDEALLSRALSGQKRFRRLHPGLGQEWRSLMPTPCNWPSGVTNISLFGRTFSQAKSRTRFFLFLFGVAPFNLQRAPTSTFGTPMHFAKCASPSPRKSLLAVF